jgi:hypothetical protein
LDAAPGRIALATSDGGLVVIGPDGGVVSRIPSLLPPGARPAPLREASLGGSVVAAISGNTLRVYRTDDASPVAQLPVSSAAGPARLLSIDDDYAAYRSGIELHLLRIRDGLDQVLSLPGEAGPVGALLTSDGLFVSYDEAYDPQPGRLLFIPASNLP